MENETEVQNVVTIFSDTDTIVIPQRMTKLQAARELELQHQEEEKIVEKVKIIEGWAYNDALVASMRVSRKTFGWINAQTTKNFFGEDELPQERKIQTGINTWEDCFIGEFKIAAWDGARCEVGATGPRHNPKAYVKITVKRKFSDNVDRFFQEIEDELKENSIYKGKCLLWSSEQGFSFIENKGTDDIVLNENEQLVLDNFIIKPLLSGKKEKRGILFAGPYGTGKTETALKIGRIANENDQTFIYCKDRNLSEVLEIAKHYQPSVVFVEDIDEMASGERGTEINDLLNTIDGIQTKGQGLTLIMTTNHKEKINQAFRRPGRIDVVLNFDLPNKPTIAIMYQKFLKSDSLDYAKLAEMTPEVQGAVIKEIANRAVLSVGEGETLNETHVQTSIELTKMQIDFMKEPAIVEENTLDKTFRSIAYEEGIRSYRDS
jgi:ATPase family associated with various cellular activities (AAA)